MPSYSEALPIYRVATDVAVRVDAVSAAFCAKPLSHEGKQEKSQMKLQSFSWARCYRGRCVDNLSRRQCPGRPVRGPTAEPDWNRLRHQDQAHLATGSPVDHVRLGRRQELLCQCGEPGRYRLAPADVQGATDHRRRFADQPSDRSEMPSPRRRADYFWSSSPLAGSSSNAWFVVFLDGSTINFGVSGTYFVRCVR